MQNSTVFVVDQDLISSMILKSRLVEDERLQIRTFNTGLECVMNSHLQPEVIVLDFQTQGVDSLNAASTLQKLRQLCPDSDIVLLSKQENRAQVMQYINDEHVHHVAKGPHFSHLTRDMVQGIIAAGGHSMGAA